MIKEPEDVTVLLMDSQETGTIIMFENYSGFYEKTPKGLWKRVPVNGHEYTTEVMAKAMSQWRWSLY